MAQCLKFASSVSLIPHQSSRATTTLSQRAFVSNKINQPSSRAFASTRVMAGFFSGLFGNGKPKKEVRVSVCLSRGGVARSRRDSRRKSD
jgi:hypothetical protein